jgi:uroporphyrinogen-III synthase
MALRNAGYRVCLAEVYCMQAIDRLPDAVREALAIGRLDGVLLYSRRTAETFARLAATDGLLPALRHIAGFVLSPAIAAGLPFGRIVTATEATEDALLLALAAEGGTSAAGKC